MNCIYCGKECKSNRSLVSHQRLCKQNPNRQKSNLDVWNSAGKTWNKGLTKETNSSVAKYAKTLTKLKPQWQLDVDDDNKIQQRYCNKRVNAKKEGIGFELSFEEYCILVKEAGLKSSQLGFTGDKYVLARYNDTGPYKYGNCRFITQKENHAEKTKSYAETHKGIEAARRKLYEMRHS